VQSVSGPGIGIILHRYRSRNVARTHHAGKRHAVHHRHRWPAGTSATVRQGSPPFAADGNQFGNQPPRTPPQPGKPSPDTGLAPGQGSGIHRGYAGARFPPAGHRRDPGARTRPALPEPWRTAYGTAVAGKLPPACDTRCRPGAPIAPGSARGQRQSAHPPHGLTLNRRHPHSTPTIPTDHRPHQPRQRPPDHDEPVVVPP